MEERKLNFTKRVIETLPLPDVGKRSYYYDTKVRGLGVSITNKGTKTFIVYKKVHGKPERIKLGHFPDISIENARTLAMEINTKISKGINPQKEKSNMINMHTTFGDLFNQYLDKYAKVHKKSWNNDLSLYNLYLKHWDNKKLSLIKRQDIEAVHARIGNQNGKYSSNRMLSLIHILFNKAIDWGWECTNPCSGVKKFKEKSRERFLQSDELPRFLEALNSEINDISEFEYEDFELVNYQSHPKISAPISV